MNNQRFNPFYDNQDAGQVLANHLMRQGSSAAPVENIWQGITRLGSAALGGYLAQQDHQQAESDYNQYHQTLADALAAPDVHTATRVLQNNPYTISLSDKLLSKQLFNNSDLQKLQSEQNMKLDSDAQRRQQALDQAQQSWDMRLDYTPKVETARQQAITDASVDRTKELGSVREELKNNSFLNQQEREAQKLQKKLEGQRNVIYPRKRKILSGGFNAMPD
ncbi:MAG: hypothetical protein ACOYK8_00440 [Alphaproteobacteria bacterium]